MLFQRVAHTPFLCLILLWTTTLLTAASAATKISSEILNFVPTCAQSCFESYILNNFNLDLCSDSPGLQCLCRQTGLTGHTIGEGAVACIVAESSRGSCQGGDSSREATSTAYNMCVGVANAAPKTHSTIVATLVVPTGTGPLSIPTASRTGSTGNPAQDVTNTVGPTPTSPTGTASPVSTSPSGTSSAAVPEQISGNSETKISSAQVAGIILGCLAVVVLGILLVFLARYLRRRRFGDVEEGGFTKMRDSISFGKKSQPGSPPELQISKPLQDGPFQWHMNRMGLPTAQEPAAIGLALSPYRTQQAAGDVAANRAAQKAVPAVLQTPPSRSGTPKLENHPPKPSLSLAIPLPPKPALGAPAGMRDSIVTEFAEDGEERASASAAANIWRPPPTDPQSAATYFAADKAGNWVLRNKPAPAPARAPKANEAPIATTEVELPSPTDKTRAERAQRFSGWFSPGAVVSPLRVPSRTGQPKLGSPIAFKNQERQQQQPPQSRRENRSSSVYSPYGAPLSVTPGPENPLPKNAPAPDTYLPLIKGSRDLTGSKTKRRSLRRPSRRGSEGSSTSIESAAAPPFEDEDIIEDEMQVDLSPVVESPISPGKSPVKYPKIRRPASGQQQGGADMVRNLSLFPMPSRETSPRPMGQPGSTPGFLVPGQKKPFNPLLGLPAHPSPNRNPGQVRTGSPGLPSNPSPHRQLDQLSRAGSPGLPANPSPNRNGSRARSPEIKPGATPAIEQQLQRQQQSSARYWAVQQPTREPNRDASPRPPFELPAEGFEVSEQPQWRPSQQQQQQQQRRPSPQVIQPAQQRRPTPQAQEPQPQPEQQQRRPPPQTLELRQEQPQRRPTQDLQQQQQPWRPSPQPLQPASQALSSESAQGSLLAKRRGADKAAALAIGDGKKPGKGWRRESLGAAPITPGIRMMTPTRKGDDLFLDVGR